MKKEVQHRMNRQRQQRHRCIGCTIFQRRCQARRSQAISTGVAKMDSHAIFQYNVLAIDDTHNTWTNVIVKMTILRLLGSSDDKEKIGVARDREEIQVKKIKIETICYHRLNR